MKCDCRKYTECEDCPCYFDCIDIYDDWDYENTDDEINLMAAIFSILF